MLRWLVRLVTAAAALALGVAVSVCVVALHGYGWGLVLGLLTTAACLVALPGGWGRWPFGTGWSLFVLLAAQDRPEGDFVIATDRAGWILLGSAVVVFISSMVGVRDHAAALGRTAPVAPPGPEPADSR